MEYRIGLVPVLCAVLLLVGRGACRQLGAPVEACVTLTPQHGLAPQTGTSPYQLAVTSGTTYAPGEIVAVSLTSTPSTTVFKGLILQARQVSDGAVVGSWQLPAGGDFQYRACPGAGDQSTITHTSNGDKALPMTFMWNAPTQSVGDVEFLFSVVQLHATFWTNMRTTSIAPSACISFPCMNGGVCVPEVSGYTCQCVNGYTGTNCDIAPPGCNPNPCMNGGGCVAGATTNSYICQCINGFSGTNCDGVNPCQSSPCMNGGACVESGTSYSCTCPSTYAGLRCEFQLGVNPCQSSPCMNGGTCVESGTSYSCTCPSTSTGPQCEFQLSGNPCQPSPCLNGGTCVESGTSYFISSLAICILLLLK